MKWWAAVVAWLGVCATALACGPCEVGDSTLTTMGWGGGRTGRWRVSAGFLHRSDEVGPYELTEQRLTLAGSWTAVPSLTLGAELPAVRRHLTHVSGARDELWTVGDVRLFGRWQVAEDGALAPVWSVYLTGSFELPTSPVLRDPDGAPYPFEVQPGQRALSPGAGLLAVLQGAPWAAFASSRVVWPLSVTAERRPGVRWLSTVRAQWQPESWWFVRGGADMSWSQPAEEPFGTDPNSGGSVLFAALGAGVRPVTRWVLSAEFRVPALNGLRGQHDEGWVVETNATVDL